LDPAQQDAVIVTLRPVQPDDQAFLLELYAASRMDELKLVGWDENQKHAFVLMQFNAQCGQFAARYPLADSSIILMNDRPIGRMLVDRSGREIALIDVSLLPEHRNAGIGTQLIQSLLDEAGRAGKHVVLHVVKTNPALHLYERLGFYRTAEDGSRFEMKSSKPSSYA
jgi:ribosomal protein S18 acetylase RimI-like enzyme